MRIQTAVEWLVNELIKNKFIAESGSFTNELVEKAKEMEKNQKGYSEKEVLDLVENFEIHLGSVKVEEMLTFKKWFKQRLNSKLDKTFIPKEIDILELGQIIPKEEIHSMDDEVECNMCGNIMSLLEDESNYACLNSECTRCYEEYEEEPKQETLEEAAENNLTYWKGFSGIGLPNAINSDRIKKSFKAGAKWQQKQDKGKYSEDDMRRAFCAGYVPKLISSLNDAFYTWLETFKKRKHEKNN